MREGKKNKLNVLSQVDFKPQKTAEKCGFAIALPAASKKQDLLSSRETKRAPTSWGRNEFV